MEERLHAGQSFSIQNVNETKKMATISETESLLDRPNSSIQKLEKR
jgi:hypothetical protein